jgi:hypothetical protein
LGLKKYKVKYTEDLVKRLNLIMRADTKLKTFLTLARKG